MDQNCSSTRLYSQGGSNLRQMKFVYRTVRIIDAPLEEGQSLTGAAQAPSALRGAGLCDSIAWLGWKYEGAGDLCMADCDGSTDEDIPADSKKYYSCVKNCATLGAKCKTVFEAVRESCAGKKLTLTIGGDHSIGSATVLGSLSVYKNLCVVWVDAHGDCNVPETSPSHHYHGMSAAHAMGLFEKRAPGFSWLESAQKLGVKDIVYIGLRDIDRAEGSMMKHHGIKSFTMKDIDELGIAETVSRALRYVDPYGERPIHLSFDIDACDPSIAPGTGTRVRGGLTYREAHYVCESVAASGRLVSMDMVEVNPEIDEVDKVLSGDRLPIKDDATKTVRLAIELITSCLGLSII